MRPMQHEAIKNAQCWLREHQSEMTSDLEALCNINSGSENLAGLRRVEDWLCKYFEPLKLEPVRIELPSFEIIDDLGQCTTQQTANALRWDFPRSESDSRHRILMSIHYDTVYAQSSAFQRCERFDGRGPDGQLEMRMRGPGVIDAKGGIVILRWAAIAAQQFLDMSHVDLSIVLTPDEEIGSPATMSLWKNIANQFDFAMLYEPCLADGSMVSQRRGTGTFTIIAHGKAAHSGRNFQDGRNAILQLCRIALALDSLNGVRPDVTLNVGRIRGGDAVNVVPDCAGLKVNVRVSSADDQLWVETQVQQIVKKFSSPATDFTIELFGAIQSPPKAVSREAVEWMKRVESAGELVGEHVRWKGSGGASDGNKLAALGLTNIDSFGPEGDLLHSDQEWIRLESLPRKAALSVAALSLGLP
jgi:glutamate carboxypeptidase